MSHTTSQAPAGSGDFVKLTLDDGRVMMLAKTHVASVTVPAPNPHASPSDPPGEAYILLASGQTVNVRLTDDNKKAMQAAGGVAADPKKDEAKPAA